MRAYRSLRTYKVKASFYTWFSQIAMNVARTRHGRKRLRLRSTDLSDSAHLEIPDPNECSQPSWSMEAHDRAQSVRKVLDSLPPDFRLVLVLRDVEGLRYRKIATRLGIPIGTVRSRLWRARLAVVEQLEPFWREGVL